MRSIDLRIVDFNGFYLGFHRLLFSTVRPNLITITKVPTPIAKVRNILYDVPYITKLKMAKSTTFQHIVVDNKKMVAFDFLTNKKVQEEIFFTS